MRGGGTGALEREWSAQTIKVDDVLPAKQAGHQGTLCLYAANSANYHLRFSSGGFHLTNRKDLSHMTQGRLLLTPPSLYSTQSIYPDGRPNII
jgi:hypothetical protein